MINLILLSLLFASPIVGAATHEVKMLNGGEEGVMVFEPAFLQVDPGDTVTFISVDQGHNTVSEFVPEGAKNWSSDIGGDFSVTLDSEGIYIYKCAPHVLMAMVGVIQVGAASNMAEARKAAETLSVSFALGKERLGEYLDKVK